MCETLDVSPAMAFDAYNIAHHFIGQLIDAHKICTQASVAEQTRAEYAAAMSWWIRCVRDSCMMPDTVVKHTMLRRVFQGVQARLRQHVVKGIDGIRESSVP